MTPKKQAAVTQPVVQTTSSSSATATAAPAVQTAPKPQTPNKQQMKLTELKEAWTKRGVDLHKLETKVDGKFMLVVVGPGWPTVKIGPTGGLDLPQIKSYPKAWDAAVNGDAMLKKQTEREQKKAAAPAVPKAASAPASAALAETPTQKKQRQAVAVEQQIEARA